MHNNVHGTAQGPSPTKNFTVRADLEKIRLPHPPGINHFLIIYPLGF